MAGDSTGLGGESVEGEGEFVLLLGGMAHVLEDGETVADKMIKSNRVVMCACGTSWHSALIGEYLFEQMAHIPVEVEYASEFRWDFPYDLSLAV